MPTQKFTQSLEHKVKAHAPDLTVISQSTANHQLALTDIDRNVTGLQIHPDKCMSIIFQGKRVLNKTFDLHNSNATK